VVWRLVQCLALSTCAHTCMCTHSCCSGIPAPRKGRRPAHAYTAMKGYPALSPCDCSLGHSARRLSHNVLWRRVVPKRSKKAACIVILFSLLFQSAPLRKRTYVRVLSCGQLARCRARVQSQWMMHGLIRYAWMVRGLSWMDASSSPFLHTACSVDVA
jgi:hypothetical protein